MIAEMESADEGEAQRQELLERWDGAAPGWSRRADTIRDTGMPVSMWMIDHLHLQPGQRVLELAAGPGDTGFLAAELILPGGTLISSDGSEAMLEIARGRARQLGIENVEFKLLELEWIDLPAASVDAIVCRWALMLLLEPAAALRECRRVTRPGGSLAVAVWGQAGANPWATIPTKALERLGRLPPPDPSAPGMFAISDPVRLAESIADAGFMDVVVESVGHERFYSGVEEYLAETRDLSRMFSQAYDRLSKAERRELLGTITEDLERYTAADGSVRLPGSALVAAASA